MVRPKRLGHLVLRVRDLERSERFYSDVLGLEVTERLPGAMVFMRAEEGASHELALMSVGADAPGPEQHRVGLYHFAWEMESLEDLRRMYRELTDKRVPIGGVGDHGVSLGVYFFDPDGNEIEAFYELPSDQWPKEGSIFAGRFPWAPWRKSPLQSRGRGSPPLFSPVPAISPPPSVMPSVSAADRVPFAGVPLSSRKIEPRLNIRRTPEEVG